MDVWTIYAMHATAAAVVALAAFWVVGRENLRLRAELDAERVDRENINMAANALRETLRKVWADRRYAQYRAKVDAEEAADVIAKLRRLVQRLWESRRRMQHREKLARSRMTYENDCFERAVSLLLKRLKLHQRADARSLTMCEELHRV